MRAGFLNESDDVQWLKEGHLKGVALPTKYSGFNAFILQGNEDAPYEVLCCVLTRQHCLTDTGRCMGFHVHPASLV